MRQLLRLGPFQGLNAALASQEGSIQGTCMRGGYNVEVVDGEWWVRGGLGVVSQSYGTTLWRWFIEGTTADINKAAVLVSGSYAVPIDVRALHQVGFSNSNYFLKDFDFDQDLAFSGTLAVTNGSSSFTVAATISGAIAVGQLVEDRVGTSRIYRVIAFAAGVGTFDRPWEDVTAAANAVHAYSPANPGVTASGLGGDKDNDLDGGVVLFEQTVAYAANAMGYVHPAVEIGLYAIIVGGTSGEIAAFPVDHTGGGATVAVIPDFVRQTQLAAPTEVPVKPLRPEVYKDRLFVLGGDPITAAITQQRTIWYSRPFDFMVWHTGIQGSGGVPNYITLSDATDPTSGLGVLGDSLIVHRRYSQESVQPYGNGFRLTRNYAGFGIWPRSRFVRTPYGHIGWSRYGPVQVTSEGIEVMIPEIEKMLVGLGVVRREHIGCRIAIHDQNRRRVYFVLGFESTSATNDGEQNVVRHQDAGTANPQTTITNADGLTWFSRCPVLAVDYVSGEAWLEDYPGICGGGSVLGQMYFVRYDGRVCPHPTGFSGKDVDVNVQNTSTCVDAMVETQWQEYGTPQRKLVRKLFVTLRALDVTEDLDGDAAKFNPQRVTDLWTDATNDVLHLCTIDVMVDEREETVRATHDISVSVADMLARSLEGNRELPLMQFQVPLRVAGRSFKLRFKNALSTAATAAGYVKGHFRLVDIVVDYEVQDSDVPARLMGDA